MLVVAAGFLLHETRGTTLWVDEWSWALDRRGWDLDTLLRPHNEHLSLIPLVIYKLLFTTVGMDHYWPYRVMVVAGHVCVVTLLFVYVSRRVGDFLAICAAAVFLFLGPGWQDIISPFQITWLLSLAAGLGALLALDRGDRRGGVLACGLLAVALLSSGIGPAIAIGVLVELALAQRSRRDLWIVAVPGIPYAAWWIAYQDAQFVQGNLDQTFHFAVESAAGALSSLAGLAGSGVPEGLDPLAWGRPLGVAAAIGLVWALTRRRPVSPRVLGLLAAVVAFWVLTGLRRAMISPPDASRYVYVGALFILLIAAELGRGIRVTGSRAVVLAVIVAAIVLTNAGTLRDAGRFLRSQADLARGDLAALEIVRDRVGADYLAASFPGVPFVVIHAGPYYSAADAYGSPAYAPDDLLRAPEGARLTADAELIRAHGAGVEASTGGVARGTVPEVVRAEGGRAGTRARCVRFAPSEIRAHDSNPALEVTVPPSGLLVRSGRTSTRVGLRRFAAGYSATNPDVVAPNTAAVLRIGADRSDVPWRARLSSQGGVSVCGLR